MVWCVLLELLLDGGHEVENHISRFVNSIIKKFNNFLRLKSNVNTNILDVVKPVVMEIEENGGRPKSILHLPDTLTVERTQYLHNIKS